MAGYRIRAVLSQNRTDTPAPTATRAAGDAPAVLPSLGRTKAAIALGPDQIACDQAIFTSVRSGNGEGYRIIAGTPGIQAGERVEITRRSPSHNGLCNDSDPEAVGLESYALPTKRHCVAYCCHAGSEHTARGGQRVYTHAAIFDRQAWRQFQANPVAVHAALAKHVQENGPILKPAIRLEKLVLTAPAPVGNLPQIGQTGANDTVDWALSAATDLLAGQQMILLNAPNPYRLLEKIILSMPEEMRETLDTSIDVKFSPARRMRLVMTAEPRPELERRIAGLPIQIRFASQPLEETVRGANAAFDSWENLLRRWWREGRRQDIQRLTAELCRGISSDALDRIASICEQTDAMDRMEPDGLRMLSEKYASAKLATKPEQVLAQELIDKAARLLNPQP